MDYSVVTTFNQSGLDLYGRRMISTWLQHWPAQVNLWVYTENCEVDQSAKNLHVRDLVESSPALVRFKQQWQHVPKATGDVSTDPSRGRRKDSGKGFKWDAVRFAHKVYSIFACAQQCNSDWLLWMDADMVCHSPIHMSDLDRMCPPHMDLCYLGRRNKYSECGLYAMNLKSPALATFLVEFQRMYDDADNGIFLLPEWHDSFVFDAVKNRMPLTCWDWSSDLGDLRPHATTSPGEGHPLINSEWGRWLDHLKGDRKQLGRSKPSDIKVARGEHYWRA
jgi:hypothetical protein